MGPKFYNRITKFLGPHIYIFWIYHFLWIYYFPTYINHLPVLRMHKTPHQNLDSIAFFQIQVKTVSIWTPWKIIIFNGTLFFHKITIFFGPHIANFLVFIIF